MLYFLLIPQKDIQPNSNGRQSETIKSAYFGKYGSPIEELQTSTGGADLFYFILDFVQKMFNILNEDRHFRNIEFFRDKDKWVVSPFFDFDCSLFSSVEDLENIIKYVPLSQPFFRTHPEQVNFLDSIGLPKWESKPFEPEGLIKDLWSDEFSIGKAEVLSYLQKIKDGVIL